MFTCPDCDSQVIPEKKGEHTCSSCLTKVRVKDDATVESLDKGYVRTIPRDTRPKLVKVLRTVDINRICMFCHRDITHSESTFCQYTDGKLMVETSHHRYHEGIGVWHHNRLIQAGVKRVSGNLCPTCLTNPALDAKPLSRPSEPTETEGGKSYKGFNTRYTQ